MRHKMKKVLVTGWCAACLCLSVLAGCAQKAEPEEVDFSEIDTICELATLKCYYHNVARAETEASGLFKIFGVGYKKIWIEYSGIVEFGIDVTQVSVSQPDENGVVTITIPDAQLLNVDLDEDSLGDPIIDTGLMTTVTTEEQTQALASAQEDMEEAAAADTALLNQAKERAKELLEAYVCSVGELLGEEYTVEFVDVQTEN